MARVVVIVGRPFRVGRRFNVMRFGPCPAFRHAEAAAMSPALLGRLTAARVILARKGNTVIFDMSGRQRNAKAGHDE